MTVKKVKNIWHNERYNIQEVRHKDALASSYLSASLIALMFAGVIMLLGLFAISDTIDSYFEERPVINIVIPPQV